MKERKDEKERKETLEQKGKKKKRKGYRKKRTDTPDLLIKIFIAIGYNIYKKVSRPLKFASLEEKMTQRKYWQIPHDFNFH